MYLLVYRYAAVIHHVRILLENIDRLSKWTQCIFAQKLEVCSEILLFVLPFSPYLVGGDLYLVFWEQCYFIIIGNLGSHQPGLFVCLGNNAVLLLYVFSDVEVRLDVGIAD